MTTTFRPHYTQIQCKDYEVKLESATVYCVYRLLIPNFVVLNSVCITILVSDADDEKYDDFACNDAWMQISFCSIVNTNKIYQASNVYMQQLELVYIFGIGKYSPIYLLNNIN